MNQNDTNYTCIWKTGLYEQAAASDECVYSDLTADLYANNWYGRLSQEEIQYYRSHIREAVTLEIGCGTGRIFIPLLECGCDMHGMEISEPMLNKLKSSLSPGDQHRVILWDALNTPYPVDDETFDMVTIPFSSFGLMHNNHIEKLDDNVMFHEFYRILRPGGLVILNEVRTYVHDRSGGMESIARQALQGKKDKDMQADVKGSKLFLTFHHYHPKHGAIKEELISSFSLKKTRLIPDLIIREREIIFTRVSDNKVLERHHEVIPVWDILEYPVLGNNANFKYLKKEETPKFHILATVNHIFQK